MRPAIGSDFLPRILRSQRLLWAAYVVVMCVVSALCFGSLRDHLLDMDDHEAFRDNIRMAEDFSFFFSSEKQQPGGRPLAELVKLAGFLTWGNDPGSFHLLVVAIHTLAAVLLAALFRRQGTGLRMSLVGGLLFLVNVAHFRAVHWIAAIEFPLALSCGLGALLCYQCFLEDRRSRWLWGFYGGFVLSIAALSAMAFLWPFCFYWSWLRNRDLRASLRPLLPLLPVVALELVVIVALTHRDHSTWLAIDQLTEGDPFGLLLGAGRLLLWLLSRLLTTAHWLPFPVYELGHWELYAGAGVLAGLGVLAYRGRLPVSLWSVWILLSVLPFLPLTDTLMLGRPVGISRFLYPATAGTSLLLAWGLEEGSRRLGTWGRYVYPGALAAILLSSYFYLKQAEAITLYSSGRTYISLGDTETGVEQLKRAVAQGRHRIDLEDAYERICFVGMGGEEDGVLDQALEAFPGNRELNTFKLALNALEPGSLLSDRAREQLKTLRGAASPVAIVSGSGKRMVLRTERSIQTVKHQIASFYHNTGNNLATGSVTPEDLDKAIIAFRSALELDPERMGIAGNLVSALAAAGQHAEAVQAALQAAERNPGVLSGILVQASLGLVASGRLDEAVDYCHRALKDGSVTKVQSERVFRIYSGILSGKYGRPGSAATAQVGRDLLDGGRAEEAVRAFRQTLAKDADNHHAHFGLGLALLSQGQVEEAEKLYAEGMARFGRAAGEEAGAVEGIRGLIARGIQVEAAREILATHWPEL